MTSTLSTLAISSAGTPKVVTYLDPGASSFTATTYGIGNIVCLPMFGGFTQTTTVTSWAITGTGAIQSANGAGTLQRAIGFWNSEVSFDMEFWYGFVTATGSITCTPTYSAALNGQCYYLQELTTSAPLATEWELTNTNTINQGTASTTCISPSITPPCAGGAYFGYIGAGSVCSAGSTSGYTYTNDGGDGEWMFNPACTSSAQAPTCTQSASDAYGGISALVFAYPTPQIGVRQIQAVQSMAFR